MTDVYDRTGILWRELEALESGSLSKLFDRRSALVDLHIYATHLGLDEWPLAGVIERNWPSSPEDHAMDTGNLRHHAPGMVNPPGLNETTRVPTQGADPLVWRPRHRVRPAPLPLRLAVWLVALLVVVGGASLAGQEMSRSQVGAQTLTGSQSASGPAAAPAGKLMVVLVSSGTGGTEVGVRAAQFSVVVASTARCWVQATAPTSTGPVFAGVLQPGDEKIIDAASGRLTVQVGASGVTVEVAIRGHPVPGWSFKPSVAPATVRFSSMPDS